jgi:chromosome segregation protein
LIASHNKRTMEAASAIYGVTMEEFGISQLISVDFKTRETSSQQASVQADNPSSSQAPVAA